MLSLLSLSFLTPPPPPPLPLSPISLPTGVGILVANAHCTSPSTRLPSRATLAAAAAALCTTSAAPGGNNKCVRRGSFPLEDSTRNAAAAKDGGGNGGAIFLDRAAGAGGGSVSTSPGFWSLPPSSSSGHRLSWRGGGARRKDRKGAAAAVGSGGPDGGGDDEVDSMGSFRSMSPPFPDRVGGGDGGGGGRRRHSGPLTSGGLGTGGAGNFVFDAGDRGSVAGRGRGEREGEKGGGEGGGRDKSGLKELQRGKALMVTCVVLRVGWTGAGRLALEATGFGVEASPPPAPGLPPLLELPTLRCGVTGNLFPPPFPLCVEGAPSSPSVSQMTWSTKYNRASPQYFYV